VIWFTLGNISVLGTYYTHALNLTPRGLLTATARLAVAEGPACSPYRTVRRSRRVGSPSGAGIPVMVSHNRINKPPNPRTQGHAIRPRPKDLRPSLAPSILPRPASIDLSGQGLRAKPSPFPPYLGSFGPCLSLDLPRLIPSGRGSSPPWIL
jgi:hypothetical protein